MADDVPRQDASEAISALRAASGVLAYAPSPDRAPPPAVQPLGEFGSLLTVGPGAPGSVHTPPLNRDVEWTIEMQALQLPGGVLSTFGAAGYLAALVTYSIGGAKFTKTIAPIGLNVRRLPVCARQVNVTVFLMPAGAVISNGTPPTTGGSGAPITTAPVQVNVAIAHGNQSKLPIEYYGPQWLQTNAGNQYMVGTPQQAVQGATTRGILLAARMSVTFMPTGAGAAGFWIMLFDQTAAGGTNPIWCSKPLTVPYDWDAFDDEFGPSIEWDQGLWIGASSTGNQYSACGGAPVFRFDCKVGQ